MARIGYYQLNPEDYQYDNYLPYLRIALFLLNNNQLNAAKLFIQKALIIAPNNPIANLIMANLLYTEKNVIFSPQIQEYLKKSQTRIWW